MLKRRMKNAQRFQEIINVFFKNGFSHILFRLGLTDRKFFSADEKADVNLYHVGKKLRIALEQLGPTFIKLGQIASGRRDLVPEEIASELEKLQDHVESFSFEVVQEIIEYELGGTIEELFQEFDKEPLASASIGQVHKARLNSGEFVAVKIQRPNIERQVSTDLSILHDLAGFLEKNMEWAKAYHLRDLIHEFSQSLREELDYQLEARNAERISRQFAKIADIHVPRVYDEYTTRKVLTTDLVTGVKVSNIQQLDKEGYDRRLLAKRIADSMLSQVMEYGFFHGDPHPGNIFIAPGPVVYFIDFGMVGQLSKEMTYHFISLLLALQRGNIQRLIDIFSSMDILDAHTNTDALYRDLQNIQRKYYETPLTDLKLGDVFMEIFSIAFRHHIRLPNEIAILSKVILTLESVLGTLDPSFSIMKAIEPYGKKAFLKQYDPRYLLENGWHSLVKNTEILVELPNDIKKAVKTIEKGKVELAVGLKESNIIFRRFDKIANRLSLSIVLLAFSILMVGLIIGSAISGQTAIFLHLPLIEVGSIVATLMFVYLLFSIVRSGRI
ncbi:AarF/ABC1/UbiB kinase family protein [Sporosarcina sp. GW1-11]|uniref:ABC1 kinase family protein n=1 Tax=Sporosarcina sp. GW1-11 TaxID=2899126 RepID=UPI00294ED705|nr:AarF/ABC1/UbiB kinase family protein [Sporosarcina sp. GW1-11]MDV6377269.1 AarF/ABC1/UbiB kinase family protein [Sporosarcina sp. GW1-11]